MPILSGRGNLLADTSFLGLLGQAHKARVFRICIPVELGKKFTGFS
jgi:hypothetical protein